ncbi:hypothetical protein [Paraburkholderia caffeinilytica]|uniref:hypothetical protein n=1 Tax=Paraburkholderia caffeinilytica TaxID=1761016 RepID=UPI003DA13EE7
MSQHKAPDSRLSDAILRIMKPLNIYTVQHLAPHLSAFVPSNLDIRTALNSLIHEGKVEVAGFFMRSATYRLSAGNAAERREELVGYTESLARRSALAMLVRRK